jgi:sarcosine oxidase
MPAIDVAVVGLGAMGSAALYHLAARGQRVVGLDRYPAGHTHGSSHGESRIIRLAYFEHPDYVPLLRLAYRNWRALEAATGQAVLLTTGIIEAGPPGSEIFAGSLASSIEHAIPHEVLSGAQIAARFPALTLPADWTGVYQPDAGILGPERVVALHLAAAKARGATVVEGATVTDVRDLGGSVELALAEGSTISAGAVVLAAGGWIGDLAPALAPHLRLTRQALVWFEPSQPALVTPDRMPIFMLDDPRTVTYGFPDWTGTGVKAASHDAGRVLVKADDARQDADDADVALIAEVLRDRVSAVTGPVRRMATCFYTRSPDEHFILGPSPGSPRIILASPCSGHGFKFASIIGEILADLAITGETDKPIGLFSPTRFGGV